MIGLAVALMVTMAPRTPPFCAPGNTEGIEITAHSLHAERIKGQWLAEGEIGFKVCHKPRQGNLAMRIQEFHPREDRWANVGEPVNVDGANPIHHDGSTFTMRRTVTCAGDLSWRIKLFVSPGIAYDGTATPPETFYFPRKAGRQLDCRG